MKQMKFAVVALVGLVAGCANDASEGSAVDSGWSASEPESELTSAIDRGPAADMKLASLATETLKCRGKLTPSDYVVEGDWLMPSYFSIDMSIGEVSFPDTDCTVCYPEPGERRIHGDPGAAALKVCPALDDADAALDSLGVITNLLAVQKLEPAMATAMVGKWNAKFEANDCPEWNFERVISGDPEVAGNLVPGAVETTSLYSCVGENCAEAAAVCASGYGEAFLLDAEGQELITDPAYWEDPRNWGYGNSPYYKAQPYGYVHNMGAYDDSFAAVQRWGEKCIDPLVSGILIKNNCSDDPAFPWYCNSICK